MPVNNYWTEATKLSTGRSRASSPRRNSNGESRRVSPFDWCVDSTALSARANKWISSYGVTPKKWFFLQLSLFKWFKLCGHLRIFSRWPQLWYILKAPPTNIIKNHFISSTSSWSTEDRTSCDPPSARPLRIFFLGHFPAHEKLRNGQDYDAVIIEAKLLLLLLLFFFYFDLMLNQIFVEIISFLSWKLTVSFCENQKFEFVEIISFVCGSQKFPSVEF